MKEITRIHLAKTPYDIELDAKEVLQKYLSEIKQMMGAEDTMYEIEARMVELLGERGVQSNGIIRMWKIYAPKWVYLKSFRIVNLMKIVKLI